MDPIKSGGSELRGPEEFTWSRRSWSNREEKDRATQSEEFLQRSVLANPTASRLLYIRQS
jgi:hypothetical protein